MESSGTLLPILFLCPSTGHFELDLIAFRHPGTISVSTHARLRARGICHEWA